MSAVFGSYTHETEASYAADFGRDREPMKKRSRHPEYRRKGSAPTRVNGMHCRRNKRWSWGSGRGARMANLRAFAGCLAAAVVSLATNAFAVTFDWATIGNPGNAANVVSGTNFGGSVADTFLMSKTETTNADYVQFLNAVDASGANARGLYSSANAANTLYGIAFNSGAASGSKYSVKAGAPAGAPVNTTYANMPVNLVSWFSAARYVNWVAGGQLSGTAGTASMDGGFAGSAYTLGSATSGNIVARNAGATFVLPSANEWYKAAFYNGTSSAYTLYATNNNSAPTATAVQTGSNSANFANVLQTTTAGPIAAGSYVNTTSAYGLYNMFGNVSEMTDTAGTTAGSFRPMGGGYSGSLTGWNATAAALNTTSTALSASTGFRVAAVPEPETITLAAFGIVGLCGANWLKRRRKADALQAHAADLVAA